jgi:asparagine synthase (glutamine-hydrolysing)
LLDHRVLEFAASLPADYKVRGFSLKYILKRALSKRVPRAILKRKKAGFPVPYESWMRGDLKNWLNGILLDRETSARGYFRKSTVEKILSENASSGKYSKELFSLAVLELWHRQFLGDERPSTPSVDSPEPSLTRA